MTWSIFKFNWQKSRPHLYLLTQFLPAETKGKILKSDAWPHLLKEDPHKAIDRFLAEGILEPADLRSLLDYRYNTAELKQQLNKLGLQQSGKKSDLIDRLLLTNQKRYQQLQHQLNLLQCSELGKTIAMQFKETETQTRRDFETSTFQALQHRQLAQACQLVAEYNQQKISLHPISPDEQDHSLRRNQMLLHVIFNSKPKILQTLSDDKLNILRIAAGMLLLWQKHTSTKWLPANFSTELIMDNLTAAHMMYSYALHQEQMALHKQNKVKRIEIICSANPCNECKQIATKKYTLTNVPELPYEHCTSPHGCFCITMGCLS